MNQLSIKVPFAATCRRRLDRAACERAGIEFDTGLLGVNRCNETFTDPKALQSHLATVHADIRHCVGSKANGGPVYVGPGGWASRINRDPRKYVYGRTDGEKINPRPTGKVKAGDGTFDPEPGKPGSVLEWTQDGVTRSGQVQFDGSSPKTVWVVPFERGEGEHAVLLGRYDADTPWRVRDTWGTKFHAAPEPESTEAESTEAESTEAESTEAESTEAVAEMTTPERETFELEFRPGAGSLPASVIIYTEDGTIEFQRPAHSFYAATLLAAEAGYVSPDPNQQAHRSASWAEALWVVRESEPERTICAECDYPSVVDGKCTNPACFPGMSDYHRALASWQRDRDAYVNGNQAYSSIGARQLRSVTFASLHPEPRPDDYRRTAEPETEPESFDPDGPGEWAYAWTESDPDLERVWGPSRETEPRTFTETLSQFTARRTREISAEHDVSLAEVSELYDWPQLWWDAVRGAAVTGYVIASNVFLQLETMHARHLAHDYPESVPPGISIGFGAEPAAVKS